MNLPNRLTIFRIFMVIPFIIIMGFAIYYRFNDNTSFSNYMLWAAGGIFLLAMITDALDGYFARKNNQITTFGKLFDPLADKFITTSAFVVLSIMGIIPFWLTLIFILRDILVDGSRNLAASNKLKVSASIWGKIKTVLQTIGLAIIFFIFPLITDGTKNFINPSMEIWLMNIPLFIAAVASIFSGYKYLAQIKPLLSTN